MSDSDSLLSMSEAIREGFAKVNEQLALRSERLSLVEQAVQANSQEITRLFKILDGSESRGSLPERITRLEDTSRTSKESISKRVEKLEEFNHSLTWKLVGLLITVVGALVGVVFNFMTHISK